MAERDCIKNIFLDGRSVISRSPQVEHERKAAIFDLLESNSFALCGGAPGPYNLHLSIEENRLAFDVRDTLDKPIKGFVLALSPFRALIREYLMICESYYEAIKTATPSQIETVDMGRRGLHNDGSQLLRERLEGKVDLDDDTARRLFTLVCVLHIRG